MIDRSATYREFLEWLMRHGRGTHTIGLVIEHFWHAMFGAHAGDMECY
jgi:hypothetical protein